MLVAIILLLLSAGAAVLCWSISRRHSKRRHRNLVIEFEKIPPGEKSLHRS